jgi:hypothetical protein
LFKLEKYPSLTQRNKCEVDLELLPLLEELIVREADAVDPL